jgi:hypothetical protein
MRKILLPFRPVSVSLLFCFRDLAIFVLTVHCISRKGGSFAPIDQLGNDIDIGFPYLISGWRPSSSFRCVSRGITGASISCGFRNEMLWGRLSLALVTQFFFLSLFYLLRRFGPSAFLECFCISFSSPLVFSSSGCFIVVIKKILSQCLVPNFF